ncbi:TA system VapC family ribonuclease toxin [Microbacterium sp.]|uniref:TA system VapC family ribonuclease toxin n=1 Tax=Microbacterium sp. TaxID=51671 RepID=UPI0039E461EE
MRLIDADVLVYAVNAGSALHEPSRTWLERALREPETLLMPWLSLIAFTRITTNPRIASPALSPEDALAVVEGWLARPQVVVPEPDARHAQHMRELLAANGGRGGDLVNDAHLAALALQYRATVVTFDNDFGRFPGVRWERPGA